jgi:hypothetical protein
MPTSAGRRWHNRPGRTTPSLIFQIPRVYSDRVCPDDHGPGSSPSTHTPTLPLSCSDTDAADDFFGS